MNEHEKIRKELWANLCAAYARSAAGSNSMHSDLMIHWADKALEEFDKRFKESNTWDEENEDWS